MAYSSTLDERYNGGFISQAAGALDASDSFYETGMGQLAEGETGYGEATLAQKAYLSFEDVDYYDLGQLSTGYYVAEVSDSTWDIGNFDYGSIDGFEVKGSYDQTITDTKLDYSSDTIHFTVDSAAQYYIEIEGSMFNDAQYSVVYNKTGELAVEATNYAAVFFNESLTGTLSAGETVSASLNYTDANGISSVTPIVYWYTYDGSSYSEVSYGFSTDYIVQASDEGKYLAFQVAFLDDDGYAEFSSATLSDAIVATSNTIPTGSVTITGTVTEDQTLTADTSGLSDGDGLGSFSYQWIRAGSDISGATSSTYALTQTDVGNAITVRVSYTDGKGTAESVTSAATSSVANVNDALTGSATITGSVVEDQTLTADTSGLSDGDGLGSFSYQWIRAGSDISGATSSTYTLVKADVGNAVTVKVSYTDSEGTAESVTSSATSSVAINSVSIYSNASVNLTDLDMSRLANYSSTTFHDNVSYSVFGNIYSDVLEVYWELEGTNYLTAFGGPIIEVGGDAITGGTVTGFIEYYWNGAEWFPFLGVDGFSVSAKELYQTVGTTDTSDEYAIFTAALSGDDVFYLSDYDETVNGYAGNDVIDGGKGNDIINGGDGNDIISGGDGNDIINDGKGYDTIDGGKGIDTFKRDYSTDYGENAFNAHINLDLGTISSADYPEDTPDYIQNIENVTLEGQFNYTVTGDSNDNEILTSSGEDVIISGVGKDLIGSAASNDTITLTGNTTHDGKFAHNVGSTTQVATNTQISLVGKVKLETVVDGGADADTINLGSGNDAFFLHDSFSGFHSSLTLTTDTHTGGASTQRIMNVETINGLGGDDIIDLTSPDYSLAGQVITINGGTGNDVIWGSDATEILIGGNGNDMSYLVDQVMIH